MSARTARDYRTPQEFRQTLGSEQAMAPLAAKPQPSNQPRISSYDWLRLRAQVSSTSSACTRAVCKLSAKIKPSLKRMTARRRKTCFPLPVNPMLLEPASFALDSLVIHSRPSISIACKAPENADRCCFHRLGTCCAVSFVTGTPEPRACLPRTRTTTVLISFFFIGKSIPCPVHCTESSLSPKTDPR